jgi:glycosyltransferase involved in cell wall biosynthesis
VNDTRPKAATEQSEVAGVATAPAPAAGAEAALGKRIIVVMPAYNAARTLERTYRDIPHSIVDKIILVDDVSRDDTVAVAARLGLDVIIHRQNLGYGGNQKTCYDAALADGADAVIMLHPDYQYDATRIPALVQPILDGEKDLMLGSRFLGDPLAGGMPRWKYISNRFLTIMENLAFGLHLSEYHTGFRAYSRDLLESIPYKLNSDDFVFDQELVAQAVACHMRIGEIAVPTRYFEEASSVNFRRSVVYGLSTMKVVLRFMLHRLRLRRSRKLDKRSQTTR